MSIWIPGGYKEPEPYAPPTWSDGTDTEIVTALEKHYAGQVDLTQYWSVGDERTVSLSAMSTYWDWIGATEVFDAQDTTMVILNVGGKELVTSIGEHTECTFIVGLKNCLNKHTMMNQQSTNNNGWDGCDRRTWCNTDFYNSIPSTIRSIFKQHKNITADSGYTSITKISNDYFSLAAEKEIFGYNTYANSTAESSLSQFDYYKTASNIIKTLGSGSSVLYWQRSPDKSYNGVAFCAVASNGNPGQYTASSFGAGIAPFGVI